MSFQILRFHLEFKGLKIKYKMTFAECDVRLMLVDLAITGRRECKVIPVRKLAATPTLEKTQRGAKFDAQKASSLEARGWFR